MIEKNMLGKFIRSKREEANLSQKEFAQTLFVTESAVSKWERGVNYPDITMISDICRVLKISEKELITASEDTSYRRMKKQAGAYERIKRLSFWIPTAIYLLAAFICLICCIAGAMPVKSFIIVAASLLCAFLFFPSVTRFFENKKPLVYFISTAVGVIVLIAVCGLVTHSIYWLPTAACGILLGYTTVLLPVFLNKYVKTGFVSTHKALICFTADWLMTAALLATVKLITPIGLVGAELTALYCFLPFIITGFIVSLKLNGYIKGGICTAVFGVFLYFLNYAIGFLIDDATVNMKIDFSNWEMYANGNIFILVLTVSLAVGIALTAIGLRKSSQKK